MPKESLRYKVIRFMGANPTASVKEITTKCGVTAGYVYNLRSELKKAAHTPPLNPSTVTVTVAKPSALQVGGDHYLNMGIQPWRAMESWMSPEAFAGFLRGNAIKYLARADKKGGIEDLKKARHYVDKLIELLEAN